MKKIKDYKIFLLIAIWIILSILLAFYRTPYVGISDEVLYKRIAENLYKWEPVISWQYPLCYPLVLSPGMAFGKYFTEAMIVINIVFKALSLFVIWILLKKVTDHKKSFFCCVLIGFSPIYFLYSRFLLAENLAAPLLIINVLYHLIFRERLIKDDSKVKHKVMYTVIAALISLSLYWTKYLMLATLPVFCLYWCSIFLFCKNEKYSLNKMKKFFSYGGLYTLVVVNAIVVYVWSWAFRVGQKMSLGLLMESMGFSAASGPTVTGYAVLPEAKWVILYIAYAFLCAVFAIAGIVVYAKKDRLMQNSSYLKLTLALIIALIYIASRHSTHVPYNAGGAMLNLVGRYTAYAAPLLFIAWILTSDYTEAVDIRRKVICAVVISAAIWMAYFLIYAWSPGAEESAGWCMGMAAGENSGFTEYGMIFCVIYCMGLIGMFTVRQKWSIILICILMSINSVTAVVTSNKYTSNVQDYSRMAKNFFYDHSYEQIAVYVPATEFYEIWGFYLFYRVGSRLDGIGFAQYGESAEKPVWFDRSAKEGTFFMLESEGMADVYSLHSEYFFNSIEDPFVFLQWQEGLFAEKEKEIYAEKIDDTHLKLTFDVGQNIICVYGSQIWPLGQEGSNSNVSITLNTEYEPIVYIYDFETLSLYKYVMEE